MVSVNFTGGIYLRIDASGNLGVFNQSGTEIVQIIGGVISGILNKAGSTSTSTPITSTTTTVPGVMTGHYVQLTPQVSTAVLGIVFVGKGTNNTGGDGWNINLYRFTAGPVAGGGAIPGGATSPFTLGSENGGTAQLDLVGAGLFTGLTAGTQYTFETAISAVTAGTASFATLGVQAIEI